MENKEQEFIVPQTSEEEFNLGMDLICQLDESKFKFWQIIKAYAVELPSDSKTFKGKLIGFFTVI